VQPPLLPTVNAAAAAAAANIGVLPSDGSGSAMQIDGVQAIPGAIAVAHDGISSTACSCLSMDFLPRLWSISRAANSLPLPYF